MPGTMSYNDQRRYDERKRPKNRSPPPSSFSQQSVDQQQKERKTRQIVSSADQAELERHYQFVPTAKNDNKWQDRMVRNYHEHLYKEYVLADLTRPGQVGLRWRTESEVRCGKGHTSCGNKHCPSYKAVGQVKVNPNLLRAYSESPMPKTESEEQVLLGSLPFGIGSTDYEVPFRYQERGKAKQELVKLRLCLRCAPLLFRKVDSKRDIALEARRARTRDGMEGKKGDGIDHEESSRSRKKKRKKKRRRYSSSSSSESESQNSDSSA